MPAAYKIKQHVGSFEPGETRGADEFPKGTDFARLLDLGAIRDMPGNEVHGGDPKVIDLLDNVEDLTNDLNLCKESASNQAAQFTATLAAKDKELAELKQELARARASAHNAEAVGAKRDAETPEKPAHEKPAHEQVPTQHEEAQRRSKR